MTANVKNFVSSNATKTAMEIVILGSDALPVPIAKIHVHRYLWVRRDLPCDASTML